MCLKNCSACDGVVEDDNIFVSEASTTLSKGTKRQIWTGVWHVRAKSRDTLYTKSGRTR